MCLHETHLCIQYRIQPRKCFTTFQPKCWVNLLELFEDLLLPTEEHSWLLAHRFWPTDDHLNIHNLVNIHQLYYKYSQFCKYLPVKYIGQNGIKTHLMIVYGQKNPRKCCERIPVEFSPGLDPAMCSRPRKSKTCSGLPEWGRGLGPGMMSDIRFLIFDVRQLCQVRAWSLTRAGNLWLGLSMSSDGLTVVFKVPARGTKIKLLKSKS